MKAFASARIEPYWLGKLREHFEVDHYDWFAAGRFLPAPEMIARLQGCKVFITESDEISKEILESCPDLHVIVDCRGTPVNIDLETANAQGIIVINTPARNAHAVADVTVALMIMVARNLMPGAQALREGQWLEKGKRWCYITFQGHELPGKSVGLIGLGAIGRLVSERLRGFGVKILSYDPFVKPETAAATGIELLGLDELLKSSDFISLHAPLNAQTRGLLGAREFALMKPTAYLINTARAALVEEKALIDALAHERIAGAALDVFHEEPVAGDYPLLHMPNVVAIPHLGGASHEVIEHQSQSAVEGLLNLLEGKPTNIVNPQTLPAATKFLTKVES